MVYLAFDGYLGWNNFHIRNYVLANPNLPTVPTQYQNTANVLAPFNPASSIKENDNQILNRVGGQKMQVAQGAVVETGNRKLLGIEPYLSEVLIKSSIIC